MKNWKRALIATILLAAAATAAEKNVGLGIVLGGPSGISAKIPSGPANSINVIVGYDLDRDCCGPGPGPHDGSLYVGADYVWYNYSLITVPRGRLPVYFGPGVNATFADNSRAGVRFVGGLEYQFAVAPFDVFLEIGPGINVIPDTRGYVTAGLGGRFFF